MPDSLTFKQEDAARLVRVEERLVAVVEKLGSFQAEFHEWTKTQKRSDEHLENRIRQTETHIDRILEAGKSSARSGTKVIAVLALIIAMLDPLFKFLEFIGVKTKG